MIIIDNILDSKIKINNACVAIGSFDGVHKGHQKLINATVKKAKEINGKSVVFTFENHPLDIIDKNRAPLIINSTEEKLYILEKLDIDIVVLQKFNKEFSDISPLDFIKLLKDKLDVAEIFVGFNFSFGKGGRGKVEDLRYLCKSLDIKLNEIEPVKIDDVVISSSLVRKTMLTEDFNKVIKYLEHPMYIIGEVVHGKKIARKLGYPTANIEMCRKLYPPFGIYGARLKIEGEDKYRYGVVNVGINPTLKPGELSFEVHILDFDQDIYGKKILLEIEQFLREEEKFDSVEKLIDTIGKDVKKWEDYVKENYNGNSIKN